MVACMGLFCANMGMLTWFPFSWAFIFFFFSTLMVRVTKFHSHFSFSLFIHCVDLSMKVLLLFLLSLFSFPFFSLRSSSSCLFSPLIVAFLLNIKLCSCYLNIHLFLMVLDVKKTRKRGKEQKSKKREEAKKKKKIATNISEGIMRKSEERALSRFFSRNIVRGRGDGRTGVGPVDDGMVVRARDSGRRCCCRCRHCGRHSGSVLQVGCRRVA